MMAAPRISRAPFLCLALFMLCFGCSAKGTTRADMDRMIQSELPDGSTQDQVVAFLQSKGARFSVDKQEIGSFIENSRPGGIISVGLEIKFYFDKNGKLVSHDTKEVFTGP